MVFHTNSAQKPSIINRGNDFKNKILQPVFSEKTNNNTKSCFIPEKLVTLGYPKCFIDIYNKSCPQAIAMRIKFEIKENLSEIIEEIMHSPHWITDVKEELNGRTTVVIRDQEYSSEATIEIYATEVSIKTAWSNYDYRISVIHGVVWCEYNGAYRGLLEQVLLPTLTPKENLLDSQVIESSLYGREHKTLKEYAEANAKLKQFRRENFNENRSGVATFDHPKRVYDEFIKEDYLIITPKKK